MNKFYTFPFNQFKILFFLSLIGLLQTFACKSESCQFILTMHDGYGDGWNGGYLQVFVNSNHIGDYAAQGFGSFASFDASDGDTLELVYFSGDWEGENSYQLYDNGWNLIFADGPDPKTGNVLSTVCVCNSEILEGNVPCTAIEIDTGTAFRADNSNMRSSGIKPGCANFIDSDIWFKTTIPISGNVIIETDSGSLNDTGLAAWIGSECTGIRNYGCDDDAGRDSYSMLHLYDLPAGQTLYIQVWGYDGAKGDFTVIVKDLGVVKVDSTNLPIIMINTLGQEIPYDDKINCLMQIKYNVDGKMTHYTDSANIYDGIIGIEIRGATSSGYPQRPYSIELRNETFDDLEVPLLGMPEESDWVTISNFNDRSLLRNALAHKMFGEMGNYTPKMQFCEVFEDSSYRGIYLFSEKIKRGKNRVDIDKMELSDNLGDELTGGYILKQNPWSEENSFQSNFSAPDHPDYFVHYIYEYPDASVITTYQKDYISSYIDSLETALYSEYFADTLIGYRKFLDVKSFIDYFIVNEVARNVDGYKKSVFYHKDKASKGGNLKLGPVWDFDWAWKNIWGCYIFEAVDGSNWAYKLNDCPNDLYSNGWFDRMLQDTTFANQLRCTYEKYRSTILDTNYIFNYIDSMGVYLDDAKERHFHKWPILGVSGPAPEVNGIATTYKDELDTLKYWICLRIKWLDENIPGHCYEDPTTVEENAIISNTAIKCFPNPTTGEIHFRGNVVSNSALKINFYNLEGKLLDSVKINAGVVNLTYFMNYKGFYYYTVTNEHGILDYGKIFVY
ncbi:MAG TPA: CotH kinase family protein [Candidatus Kapabacteria bacterium]|nr:CotH kinase family protein [Candidatus Kapabacteria bacterium]